MWMILASRGMGLTDIGFDKLLRPGERVDRGASAGRGHRVPAHAGRDGRALVGFEPV